MSDTNKIKYLYEKINNKTKQIENTNNIDIDPNQFYDQLEKHLDKPEYKERNTFPQKYDTSKPKKSLLSKNLSTSNLSEKHCRLQEKGLKMKEEKQKFIDEENQRMEMMEMNQCVISNQKKSDEELNLVFIRFKENFKLMKEQKEKRRELEIYQEMSQVTGKPQISSKSSNLAMKARERKKLKEKEVQDQANQFLVKPNNSKSYKTPNSSAKNHYEDEFESKNPQEIQSPNQESKNSVMTPNKTIPQLNLKNSSNRELSAQNSSNKKSNVSSLSAKVALLTDRLTNSNTKKYSDQVNNQSEEQSSGKSSNRNEYNIIKGKNMKSVIKQFKDNYWTILNEVVQSSWEKRVHEQISEGHDKEMNNSMFNQLPQDEFCEILTKLKFISSTDGFEEMDQDITKLTMKLWDIICETKNNVNKDKKLIEKNEVIENIHNKTEDTQTDDPDWTEEINTVQTADEKDNASFKDLKGSIKDLKSNKSISKLEIPSQSSEYVNKYQQNMIFADEEENNEDQNQQSPEEEHLDEIEIEDPDVKVVDSEMLLFSLLVIYQGFKPIHFTVSEDQRQALGLIQDQNKKNIFNPFINNRKNHLTSRNDDYGIQTFSPQICKPKLRVSNSKSTNFSSSKSNLNQSVEDEGSKTFQERNLEWDNQRKKKMQEQLKEKKDKEDEFIKQNVSAKPKINGSQSARSTSLNDYKNKGKIIFVHNLNKSQVIDDKKKKKITTFNPEKEARNLLEKIIDQVPFISKNNQHNQRLWDKQEIHREQNQIKEQCKNKGISINNFDMVKQKEMEQQNIKNEIDLLEKVTDLFIKDEKKYAIKYKNVINTIYKKYNREGYVNIGIDKKLHQTEKFIKMRNEVVQNLNSGKKNN